MMMFHRTPPGRRLSSRLPSLVALLCGGAPILAAKEPVALRIDPGQRFQNIRGFGASGAWWTNYVAEYLEEDRRRIQRLPRVTSDEHDLAPLPVPDPAAVAIPARSVTTLILRKVGENPK